MTNCKLLILLPWLAIGLMAGCAKISEDPLSDMMIPGSCEAYDCHGSTQLEIYPPVSGAHQIHTGYTEIGVALQCQSCHYNYSSNLLHKNCFINGWDWHTSTRMPGTIVYPGPDVDPAMSFDPATGTCSGITADCHGTASHNWYSFTAPSCYGPGSCHAGAPLNEPSWPTSGEHGRSDHRVSCSTCHNNYFRNTLHRNGVVNGSPSQGLAGGHIVYFINPFASYNDSTSRCSNSGCHGTESWY